MAGFNESDGRKRAFDNPDEFMENLLSMSAEALAIEYGVTQFSVRNWAKILFDKTIIELKTGVEKQALPTGEKKKLIEEFQEEMRKRRAENRNTRIIIKRPKVLKEAPHCGYIW